MVPRFEPIDARPLLQKRALFDKARVSRKHGCAPTPSYLRHKRPLVISKSEQVALKVEIGIPDLDRFPIPHKPKFQVRVLSHHRVGPKGFRHHHLVNRDKLGETFQAPHMIRIRVREDQEIDVMDAKSAQSRPHDSSPRVKLRSRWPCINQHGPPLDLDHGTVPLPYLQGHHSVGPFRLIDRHPANAKQKGP